MTLTTSTRVIWSLLSTILLCLGSAAACSYSAHPNLQVSRNFVIEVRFEGKPTPNASVKLWPYSTLGNDLGPYKTDRNGRIVLTHIPEGDFRAVYERAGLFAESAFSVVAFPNEGHESLIVLDLAPNFLTARSLNGSIFWVRGFITAQRHTVLQRNLDIELRCLSNTQAVRIVHVDAEGAFKDELPEGMYVARIPVHIPHPSSPDRFTTGIAYVPINIQEDSATETLSIGIHSDVCGIYPYEQLKAENIH